MSGVRWDGGFASGDVKWRDMAAYDDKVELHKGRHSTVCSARFIADGQVVAIKAYEKRSLKPRQMKNVYREVSLLNMLNAARVEGVVNLLSSFEDDDYVYLVFEACMRGDLYQLLVKQKGAMTERFVATQVATPLLTILCTLHNYNIVHRDIKPENIFLNIHGHIQVGDFGLAALKTADKLTERVGTLDYMAPEVLSMPTPDEAMAGRGKGLPPYNEKVDVWAVGVLCYELLVGKPPFEVEDPKETAKLILAAKLGELPSHLTPSCCDFITQALQRKAKHRPSADDLLSHPWLAQHQLPSSASVTAMIGTAPGFIAAPQYPGAGAYAATKVGAMRPGPLASGTHEQLPPLQALVRQPWQLPLSPGTSAAGLECEKPGSHDDQLGPLASEDVSLLNPAWREAMASAPGPPRRGPNSSSESLGLGLPGDPRQRSSSSGQSSRLSPQGPLQIIRSSPLSSSKGQLEIKELLLRSMAVRQSEEGGGGGIGEAGPGGLGSGGNGGPAEGDLTSPGDGLLGLGMGVPLTEMLGARRASSGTSEYYNYSTPAKPASPESFSRSNSMSRCPEGAGAPGGMSSLSQGIDLTSVVNRIASAQCLSIPRDPQDPGAGGTGGLGAGPLSPTGMDTDDPSAGGTAGPIAWQSPQLAGAAKRAVGKSRFAR